MKADSIYALIGFENSLYSYKTTLGLIRTDPIAILTLNIYGHQFPKSFRIESSIKRSDLWVKKVNISFSKSICVFVCIYRNYSHDTGTYKKIWFRYNNTYYRLNTESSVRIIYLYELLCRNLT